MSATMFRPEFYYGEETQQPTTLATALNAVPNVRTDLHVWPER